MCPALPCFYYLVSDRWILMEEGESTPQEVGKAHFFDLPFPLSSSLKHVEVTSTATYLTFSFSSLVSGHWCPLWCLSTISSYCPVTSIKNCSFLISSCNLILQYQPQNWDWEAVSLHQTYLEQGVECRLWERIISFFFSQREIEDNM